MFVNSLLIKSIDNKLCWTRIILSNSLFVFNVQIMYVINVYWIQNVFLNQFFKPLKIHSVSIHACSFLVLCGCTHLFQVEQLRNLHRVSPLINPVPSEETEQIFSGNPTESHRDSN